MIDVIRDSLVKAIENYAQRVHQWAEPLSDEQFWKRPFPFGNSFGHLVLHLTGNLNYYIGAQMMNSGYVRDREREFTEGQPPSKQIALARFDDAVAIAKKAIQTQTAEQWASPFTATGMPPGFNRFDAVLQCTSHIFHHVGQMIYLQKQWDSIE